MTLSRRGELPFAQGFLQDLWEEAKSALPAQFGQRTIEAVFLEGSIAEGFGNARSDVDFVALVNDGTKVATMPYVLFLRDRRVEVRLLSRERLERELRELRTIHDAGQGELSSCITWNQLERCQRFMHGLTIAGPDYCAELRALLGVEVLGKIVEAWFVDFSREAARYALAMAALGQHAVAKTWLRTATFHAAKAYVARRGEHYLGSKWLALQLERANVEEQLQAELRRALYPSAATDRADVRSSRGVELLRRLGVDGVEPDDDALSFGRLEGVTTWQIGRNLHVVRGNDVFRLSPGAARAWRSVVFGKPLRANEGPAHEGSRLSYYAEFVWKGLVSLCWDGRDVRAGHTGESRVVDLPAGPALSVDGARLALDAASEVQLLPMPAKRFAEAGVNLTWAHIGVENALEDSLGAFRSQQWGVLEYTLQRVAQAASLVALAAHGATPQPPLEEACFVARRLLTLPPDVVSDLDNLAQTAITDEVGARAQLELAQTVADKLRSFAGEREFPASFDTEAGWCDTILYGYDWFNLATHLDAPFPASAAGGRGTAEEARDLLAANLG